MEFHPVCQLFPKLPDRQFEELAADIKRNGLREPIWTHQGKIIDGRNRFLACRAVGVEPQLREWAGDGSLIEFVLSQNLYRRHLKESQRAAVAVLLGPNLDPAVGDKLETAAKLMNVSRGGAYEAQAIREKSPETFSRIHSGDMTVHAAKLAVQKAESRELSKNLVLPEGRYRTIVVDPPWPMEKIPRTERPNQQGFEYPTMTHQELVDFPLGEFAHEDCHLYLWTTHKHLPFAFELAEYWDFRYQCLMTWTKNVGFTPFSWMYSTEHVLFCRRGSLDLLKMGLRLDFAAKVREHSRKPDEFYDLVRQASPEPRIDVFGREVRDGFAVWGSEADRFSSAPVRPLEEDERR